MKKILEVTQPASDVGAPLGTALELVQSREPAQTWDPFPNAVAVQDRQRTEALAYQQQAELTDQERGKLAALLRQIEFSTMGNLDVISSQYFDTEFRNAGRTWAEMCLKYKMKRREPLPVPKAAQEVEKLRREAYEATQRADTAEQRLDAQRFALAQADEAEKVAHKVLAVARDIFQQRQKDLQHRRGVLLGAWKEYEHQQGPLLYHNVAVIQSMVDDFPRMEKLLSDEAEAATAHYAKLREEFAA